MNHTDSKFLSLSTALLLCIATLTLAAPPDGKGKPPKGNQPVAATAIFLGEISSIPSALQGELIDNGGFDTLHGQLAVGETITVTGDAGEALMLLEESLNELDPPSSLLPEEGVISSGDGETADFASAPNPGNVLSCRSFHFDPCPSPTAPPLCMRSG